MNIRIVFTLLLFCLSHLHLSAQNRVQKIDQLISFCADNGMFNGNILVAEQGKIIYHQSIGIADFKTQRPLSFNTSFCVGSISKQFTAFAIMLLKDQGKLDYTHTVGDIFPELPSYMHEISIKNLMQHTSGLKRTHYGEHDGLKNEEIYQNFLQSEGDTLLFQPGTDLRYSNSGYMLLAMIVERVSGQSYESFLHEHAWLPLGMTNTYVMSEDDIGRPDKAIGYDGFGNKADFNVLTYGSNGVYTTTEDLFRWNQSWASDILMNADKKSEAWTPAVDNHGNILTHSIRNHTWNYGFGQFIYRDSLQGLIGHVGGYGGFLNIVMHDLQNNRDVILLTNNGRLIPISDVGVAIQMILRGGAITYPKVSIDYELRKKHFSQVDEAIAYYHQLKQDFPNKYKFDNEWELNRFAYSLMVDKRLEDAIKVLKLLIAEFPDRPNPYDSLGEAYFQNGQYTLSIDSYEKALEIDPTYNTDWILEMIQKNREKLAEANQ